ncbi:methyltransferase type 12 [Mycolicibacterium wolinskyi]|uniref:Methyltransferase type 12 n=1 Tax=Mycolicibacterium wolinskyi TaxID=59750 RepID=A0A132PMU1_9MYCO|nr:methyltransferase type 12 [Mycolicibacterium wolinskyi]
MPDPLSIYTNRRRADSFGAAADDYDRYRPRYPRSLITSLVTGDRTSALDVGAGTGIASEQLRAAGAEVLAVEPDPRMAQVAVGKGVTVEQATFEDWDPRGRHFDLVVFASSFHWVEPRRALHKVATLLKPGGHLALMWNRVTPMTPSRSELDEVYAGFLDPSERPTVDADRTPEVTALIEECGFAVELRRIVEHLHYDATEWVNMVGTYSNVLTLPAHDRLQLRDRLEQRIGSAGVDAENDAIAVVCTPR